MSKTEPSGLRSMENKHKQLTILRCKVVVVGDCCVGKTALTQVFQSGGSTYPKNYLMTTNVEFSVKQVPIPDTNIIVEIFIYDCAGQPIFNLGNMMSSFFENVSAVMVVYDISNKESLQSCAKWVSSVRAARPIGPQLIGVLVGNKSDFRQNSVYNEAGVVIDSRAQVIKEDAIRTAQSLELTYFEASAALNNGVEDPFKFIAYEYYKKYEDTVTRF